MSFISNLTELKNRINTLRGDNAVTPFAYDSEAYEADDADGHADFDSRRHNNIPLKDNLVLGLNPFVTNKGLRDQASSFTRQLINHFCGRTSYNLNKSVDVAHGLLDKTLAYANQPEGFPMLGADGRIDSSQLPESAVEYKGTWNAETNTPHLVNGTGNKGDMYLVSQAGEQRLWEALIWNRVAPWVGLKANSIVSLCYGNGIWLALDVDNEYFRSDDNFQTVTTGLSSTNTDICFNNGRFFICTNRGEISYSIDANNWAFAFSTPVNSLSCIRGDRNTVMAGGSEGIIRSISNGDRETFTVVSEVSVSKIFGNNGTWVACKTDGGLLVSSDNGDTWTDIEGATSDINFISIFANNGKWVASTEGQGVWISSDTVTWSMISSIPEKAVCSYVYSYDNIWVICANGGTDETATLKGTYISYDNAVTWFSQEVGVVYQNGLSAVCCNGDIWISFTKGFSLTQTVLMYRAEYGAVVTFLEGDEVVYNGSVWERIPVGTVSTISGVSPVNGNVEVTGKNLGFDKSDIQNTLSIKKDMDYDIQCVYYANGIWVAGSYKGYTVRDSQGLWWSTDGKTWVQSNKTTGAFYTVYYANGIWLAGSSDYGLWWSTDGKNWVQSNKTTGVFYTVYYANGIWVAGSNNQGLWWSEDGKTWTQSNKKTSTFHSVYYANGLWVAGSTSGLWWSTDGKTWTKITEGTSSYEFNTVYYANGIWLAGSSDYGLWWSTDGKTWTQVTGDTSSYDFITVYYGNGIWVAGSYKQGLWWSTDGKTWTQGSGVARKTFSAVYYANGIWLAGSSDYGLWWSTDGKNWVQSNEVSGTFRSIYYANGIWLAGSSNQGLWWSTDGKVWTQGSGATSDIFYTVYYANGFWVAGSTSGLWWSTDGKTWTQVTGTTSTYAFRVVYYANGIWVAGSESHGLWWSTDGKNWTQGSGATSYIFYTVYYANGIWVAGSNNQGLWWSEDGKTWTQVTGDTVTYTLVLVYYANGIWIAGSESHGLWWSADGKTWVQSNKTTGVFYTVYYANGIWLAGSDSQGLWWSEDGKTWTQVTGDTSSYDFRTVYYANGIWVAGSSNQGLWWSTDGKVWTQGSGATSDIFYTVYYANGIWVAGSTSGLWWSTDGQTWTQVTGDTSSYLFITVYYANGIWVAGSQARGLYKVVLIINITQAISYIKSKLGIQ